MARGRLRSYKFKIPWPEKTPGGPNPHWVEFFRDRTETRYQNDGDLYWGAMQRLDDPPYPPFRNLPFADPRSHGMWRIRGTITSTAYKWGARWTRWLYRARMRLDEKNYAPGGSGAVAASRSFQSTLRSVRAQKRKRA